MNLPAFDLSAFNLEDIDAALAERKLYDFVRVSWPVLHPTIEFTDSWHIGAICEHLQAVIQGEINNLIVNVAPRMTKSVVASIDLTPWTWGPRNQPAMTFMYVSFRTELASYHAVKCRELIESSWYKRHWGDRFRLSSDQNQKLNFANDKYGQRSAFGMGGVAGRGGMVLVIDDPHDTKDWLSPTRMKTTCDTYDSAIHNRTDTPNDPKRVVIAQRISDMDLSGHLLKQKDWEYLMLPTEYDPKRSTMTSIGWKDPRKRAGELLCDRRYDKVQVAKEKQLRPRTFAAQHQQNPSTDETAIFKRNRWRFYRDDPKELAKHMQVVILSVDAAFKDKGSSSMVAIHCWGKLNANKFLLDRDTDHMDFVETCDRLTAMCRRWPQAKAKIIEGKANGPAIISKLRNEIPGLIEWPPEGEKMSSKEARAYAIQPEHEAGNLWLPNKEMVPWVEEYIELLASFPGGEWDDDVACTCQAVARLDRTPSAAPPEGVGQATRWLR